MKPILKFPQTILLPLLALIPALLFSLVFVRADVQVPFAPDYESPLSNPLVDPIAVEDFSYWNGASGEETEDEMVLNSHREGRAMYLAQGVEFVFPIGVQYTLANVNEQIWPIGTNGFDSVLEFPKNKIAIMFSSMINTLKIANFTVSSKIYTGESVQPTTALRILGTDLKSADFRNSYKETWASMNKDVSVATAGAIPEFVPRGGLYGRSIYPFTTATYINTIHYENQWAFPWRQGVVDRFTDSPLVPYLEVEGLMPYYENEAFIAIAALFKSGTGSVVFLKPKGNVSILQLMLNPTALTQIFDENFPGWGVKQMRVRVPEASFTTNSQHHDMLVKRGVTNSFCVQDNPLKEGDDSRNSLNPIVQTNHIRIGRDTFAIASVTGVTLNNEKDLKLWNARQRDDMAPETLLEEYTTPKEGSDDDIEMESTTITADDEVIMSDEEATTSSPSQEGERSALNGSESSTSTSTTTTTPSTPPSDGSSSSVKGEKKGGVETFQPQMDTYEFNEPFLWFLHAINEEPMFMGVVESFKRYLEETGNKENAVSSVASNTPSERGVIEKNSWIYEAAKGVLWHCPSMINKQTDEEE